MAGRISVGWDASASPWGSPPSSRPRGRWASRPPSKASTDAGRPRSGGDSPGRPTWRHCSEPQTAPDRPAGRVIYLRRTNEQGEVILLRQRFLVAAAWPHRLVRIEGDLAAARLRCYALRRRESDDQPLLAELPFDPPWPRQS